MPMRGIFLVMIVVALMQSCVVGRQQIQDQRVSVIQGFN